MARDICERVFWTAIAQFLSTLLASPLLGVDMPALRAAAVAGLGGAATALLAVARWRLSVLPDPGAGLPPRREEPGA